MTRDDGTAVTLVGEGLSGSPATDTGAAYGRRYTYQVSAVVDGASTRSAPKALTVRGNRPPVPMGTLANRTLSIGDPLSYRATSSSDSVAWATVRGSTVTVMPSSGGTATVTVTATDTGSSNTSATQQFQVTVRGLDYDTDDDGLIEIRTPAQLDAVRHDLDGDGDPAGASAYARAFPGADVGMGCGSGCTG